VLLEGQRAVPKRLLDLGFTFRFPDVTSALVDLLQ
jgi:NAD dependent epimerase/dehydratase family enzyme